jgi:hypothetical protein
MRAILAVDKEEQKGSKMTNRRKTSQKTNRRLSPEADRVRHVLWALFAGSQTALAASVRASQSAISRVVSGKQEPSVKMMRSMATLPGVDKKWALEGIGVCPETPEPVLASEPFLPVVDEVFPKMTADRQRDVSSERRAIAPSDYRPTRYFFRVSSLSVLTQVPELRIAAADLLLVETDASRWDGNLAYLSGRLCATSREGEPGNWQFVRARWVGGQGPDLAPLSFDLLRGEGASALGRKKDERPTRRIVTRPTNDDSLNQANRADVAEKKEVPIVPESRGSEARSEAPGGHLDVLTPFEIIGVVVQLLRPF